MKKRSIVKNSLILTGFSLAMRVSGILFSMYVATGIGAEGMGLYQLTYSAFAFGVTAATAGISVAVTRVLTEEQGRGRQGSEGGIMRCALFYATAVSAAVMALVLYLSEPIGTELLGDPRTVRSLRVLSPALPLMAWAACFKGQLLAVRRPVQIAISDAMEQAVEVGAFLLLIRRMPDADTETACAMIAAGVTLSELLSCAYLAYAYLQHRERRGKPSRSGFFRRLMAVALPVAGSSILASGLRTMENVMVPAGLEKSGLSAADALSQYGMVRGMAIPVIFLPFAFLSAVTSLLMPEVSEAQAAGQDGYIRGLIRRVIRYTLLLSFPAMGIFFVFAHPIAALVYENDQVGMILLILAPLVPLMYFDAVADGILKGLGQQNWVLRCNIVDSVIRVILVWRLIPAWGFTGFMTVMYVSNILNPVLSVHRMMRLSGVRMEAGEWLGKPVLAAAAAALLTRALCLRHPVMQTEVRVVVTEMVLLVLLYIGFLLLLTPTTIHRKARQRA
ncbi:MAG: hypothetical protein E7458_00960 [Ruminococcaceae bacterium]|nr:hypothetical protein [Oscillospiraceae bacterium]